MTPIKLFLFFLAVDAGLAVLGIVLLSLFVLLLLLRGVIMSAKRG